MATKTYTYDRAKLKAQVALLKATIKGKVGKGLYQGLVKLGIEIQGEAQRNAPRDTGNLMASAFTIGSGMKGRPVTHRTPKPKKLAPEPAAIEMASQETRGYVASRKGPLVVVGFGASYAEHVHEGDPGKRWHDGGPQFLAEAVQSVIPRANTITETEMAKHITR